MFTDIHLKGKKRADLEAAGGGKKKKEKKTCWKRIEDEKEGEIATGIIFVWRMEGMVLFASEHA